jgi:hypothetical protein
MERLGIAAKNSRPFHPQICGKVERLHQTPKRYLSRQVAAKTLVELQGQLDAFAHYYNAIRPHRALGGRTPLQAYSARVKARPAAPEVSETHFRIRHDKVDDAGTVTLRHDSKLHQIGLGRAHEGKPIKLLVADRDIRVLDTRTGELIRGLTLDPSRDYSRSEGAEVSTMSRDICLRCRDTSQSAPSWIRTSGLLLRRDDLSSLDLA